MSVIFKGMWMPQDCDSCWIPGSLCLLWTKTDVGNRHQDCPLVELPEKHGRLIDADALLDEYALMTCEIHGFRIEPLGVGNERATLKFKPWREVPTIVEAEGDDG